MPSFGDAVPLWNKKSDTAVQMRPFLKLHRHRMRPHDILQGGRCECETFAASGGRAVVWCVCVWQFTATEARKREGKQTGLSASMRACSVGPQSLFRRCESRLTTPKRDTTAGVASKPGAAKTMRLSGLSARCSPFPRRRTLLSSVRLFKRSHRLPRSLAPQNTRSHLGCSSETASRSSRVKEPSLHTPPTNEPKSSSSDAVAMSPGIATTTAPTLAAASSTTARTKASSVFGTGKQRLACRLDVVRLSLVAAALQKSRTGSSTGTVASAPKWSTRLRARTVSSTGSMLGAQALITAAVTASRSLGM
mmetsp:Transcript_50489/g.156219  ORF Transcript_50489/g.156219 Transcript_50489/m.156219 type:complete len:307 (+) Transcript_50489:270-1190(+)